MGADSLSEWPLFFFRGKAGCAKEGGAGSGVAPRDPERRTGGPQLRRKEGPWAGGRNGGAMGRKRLNLKEHKKKDNVVTIPQADGGEDGEADGNGEKAAAEENEKAKRKGSKKALRHAMKKALKENKEVITSSLVTHTIRGDMRSANLMVSLMEKKKDGEVDDDWDGPGLSEILVPGQLWKGSAAAKQTENEEEKEAEAA